GQVQVKSNVQTQLDVQLNPRSVHTAWAEVRSQPPGAEIVIDGVASGQTTPARVKTTAGTHRVTLALKGYRSTMRIVAVDEGQTVQVDEALQRPQ
ncbi:MAG TPA: PEGA domain-containing protein, partial [Methylomirabilota bacterium]|nr:PEGA domain-containing protein [Methylomirabilota bacterium]